MKIVYYLIASSINYRICRDSGTFTPSKIGG